MRARHAPLCPAPAAQPGQEPKIWPFTIPCPSKGAFSHPVRSLSVPLPLGHVREGEVPAPAPTPDRELQLGADAHTKPERQAQCPWEEGCQRPGLRHAGAQAGGCQVHPLDSTLPGKLGLWCQRSGVPRCPSFLSRIRARTAPLQ